MVGNEQGDASDAVMMAHVHYRPIHVKIYIHMYTVQCVYEQDMYPVHADDTTLSEIQIL